MTRIFFISLLLCSIAFSKVNINTASKDELSKIGFSSDEASELLSHRQSIGFFNTIFELQQLENFTVSRVHEFKHLISCEIPKLTTFEEDIKKASYKLGQWISNEGNTEGLSEIWLDKFFEPQNVNHMNYDDLMSLPNLSSIDAVAVLKQQQRGKIFGTWELKNAPGISRWGYKNLVDFIRFNDSEEVDKIHVRFNTLIRTVPITSNPDEDGTIEAFKDASLPEQFHKFSLTKGQHFKAGYTYHTYMGQPEGINTQKSFIEINKFDLPFVKLDRAVLGNFTASYGQGVVFESSDYFSPHRTGFGFSKRSEGIHADLTRSCQYVLNGVATQFSNSLFRGSMFASYHPRDAIVNADGSFTSLIVMQPRLPFGANEDSSKIYHSLIGSVNEVTWGGNIRFVPQIGTHFGFTFFESLYDRQLKPQVVETITGGNDDTEPEFSLDDYDDYSGDAFYLDYITNSTDAEIASMNYSIADSPLWEKAKAYVRVAGCDFMTVISNVSIQGEFGHMFKFEDFKKNPNAFVVSAYTQFPNFNLLALYRNYDIEYDNPYQRSYSNYQRFKTSIFEDTYWLEDPIFAFLYTGNPQPQAEEGFFISSRYQFHRSLVGTLNWDTWNRKADNAKYYRTVASVDWRPAFNCRIKIRQKWQARGEFDLHHPSPFYSRETRIQARLRMSRYNQFEILYSNGYTTFAPRPRLTDSAIGGEMTVGNIGTPDESVGVSITHHFDEKFTMKSGLIYLSGFLWYFEDTDFRVFNSENGAVHTWASVDLKPSPLFRVMLKISHTHEANSTKVVDGLAPSGNWVRNPQVTNKDLDFRIQVNYAL